MQYVRTIWHYVTVAVTLTCCTGEQSWKQHQAVHDWCETGRLAIMSHWQCLHYISGVISCVALNEQNIYHFESGKLLCITNIMYECFYTIHHQSVIVYWLLGIKVSHFIVPNIHSIITTFLLYIQRHTDSCHYMWCQICQKFPMPFFAQFLQW